MVGHGKLLISLVSVAPLHEHHRGHRGGAAYVADDEIAPERSKWRLVGERNESAPT
jgi:hypothetical protein